MHALHSEAGKTGPDLIRLAEQNLTAARRLWGAERKRPVWRRRNDSRRIGRLAGHVAKAWHYANLALGLEIGEEDLDRYTPQEILDYSTAIDRCCRDNTIQGSIASAQSKVLAAKEKHANSGFSACAGEADPAGFADPTEEDR